MREYVDGKILSFPLPKFYFLIFHTYLRMVTAADIKVYQRQIQEFWRHLKKL